MPVAPILIQAPTTEPAKFGLLDTFEPQRLPEHGGLAGVTYDTDFCGIARPWVAPCVDDLGAEKQADDGIDQTTGEPIPIYHLFSCRLVGSSDREARALRSLDLGASRAVEEGFGSVIAAAAVDITPGGGTPVSVKRAFAAAEQHAGLNYGGVPVIHATRDVVTEAIHEGIVEPQDGVLKTLLGTTVVAGPGYIESTVPTPPAAGASWMYVTGAVHVWEGNEFVSETVLNNPYDNEFYVLAERIYVPTFECFAAAIETTLEA